MPAREKKDSLCASFIHSNTIPSRELPPICSNCEGGKDSYNMPLYLSFNHSTLPRIGLPKNVQHNIHIHISEARMKGDSCAIFVCGQGEAQLLFVRKMSVLMPSHGCSAGRNGGWSVLGMPFTPGQRTAQEHTTSLQNSTFL